MERQDIGTSFEPTQSTHRVPIWPLYRSSWNGCNRASLSAMRARRSIWWPFIVFQLKSERAPFNLKTTVSFNSIDNLTTHKANFEYANLLCCNYTRTKPLNEWKIILQYNYTGTRNFKLDNKKNKSGENFYRKTKQLMHVSTWFDLKQYEV